MFNMTVNGKTIVDIAVQSFAIDHDANTATVVYSYDGLVGRAQHSATFSTSEYIAAEAQLTAAQRTADTPAKDKAKQAHIAELMARAKWED